MNNIGRKNAIRTVGRIVAFHDRTEHDSPTIEIEFTDEIGTPSVGYAIQNRYHNQDINYVGESVQIDYWDITENEKKIMDGMMRFVVLLFNLVFWWWKGATRAVNDAFNNPDPRYQYQIYISD